MSNLNIEKGDIKSAIFFRKKMMFSSNSVPIIEYYYLASMQIAVGNYKECLTNAKRYQQSPLADKRFMIKINGMIQNSLFALNAIKNPVNIGANATPIFPQTPFIPNRKPTLPGRFTIIAIPTGW